MTGSRRLKHALRYTMMRSGRLLDTEAQRLVASVHSYLELGAWTRSIGAKLPKTLTTRYELFGVALAEVTGNQPLYLEFGVFRGDSFRWWMEHLTNEKARFVGFDSFEGLPENWNPRHSKGHFAVAGEPQLPDDRGHFEAGWFENTLPKFFVPPHDQLILNIDCDLYSSSLFVLRHLKEHLKPGTLIYFDEFNDRDHEFRAFREFLSTSSTRVEILGTSQGGVNWLMKVI